MRASFSAAVAAFLLVACQPDAAEEGLGEGETSASRVLVDGTPEAIGVLALLNDASTTVTVLDVDAGLDSRAAKNLIAHRDGKDGRFGTADDDKYGTVDEVDAVSYVGDAALADLLAYATDNGWVPEGSDYYGSIEGVELTFDEAGAIVALCNTASVEVLDVDVALDSRAANGIVAKRPFTTVEQIAAVSYVGTSALEHLKDYAAAPATLSTDDAVAALTTASAGLYFMSESDYPLTVWVIEGGGTPAPAVTNIQDKLASEYTDRPEELPLSTRAVEQRTIADVFDRMTVSADWWEDWQHEQAPQWQAVRDVFESGLEGGTVFRAGKRTSTGDLMGAIDVFVVGVSAEGDLVVVWTISVET